MNKLTNIINGTILTTLLLTVAGTALAQDPAADRAGKGPHQQRGHHPMPAVDNMMRAIRHLDLSEEQEASIQIIMQGLKAEVRPLAKEMKAGHKQLRELIKAATYDEQAVAALAEKEGALAAERLIITSRAMSDVYAQLTDEQRAELEIMAEQRKQRIAGKRAEKCGQDPDNS